ncbi:MAG: hypothetical protein Kow00124_30680 [Anaerolineae bacterium]
MVITFNWDDREHTLLLIEYSDPWTWDEFFETSGQIVEMAEGAGQPIDVILDIRHSTPTPVFNPPARPDRAHRQLHQAMHDIFQHARTLVIVGANGLQSRLGEVAIAGMLHTLGLGIEVLAASSLDQAYRLIGDRRRGVQL